MLRQEDIFEHFRNLTGAKRIEILCGMLSMCIPLEVRFFETFINDLASKDHDSYLEATAKANSIQEIEEISKYDLLTERTTIEISKPNKLSTVNSVTNTQPGASASNAGNVGNSNASNPPSNTTVASGTESNSEYVTKYYPCRSKMIISMCLLDGSNRQTSAIGYQLFRTQLTAPMIQSALYHLYLPKNYDVESVFNEVLLLLTLAMYHPAFNYEEKDMLMLQKEEIEQIFDGLKRFSLQQQHQNQSYELLQAVTQLQQQQQTSPHLNSPILSLHSPGNSNPPAPVQVTGSNYPLPHNIGLPYINNTTNSNGSNSKHQPTVCTATGQDQYSIHYIPGAGLPAHPLTAGIPYSPQQLIQDMSVFQINSPVHISSASSSPSPALSTSSLNRKDRMSPRIANTSNTTPATSSSSSSSQQQQSSQSNINQHSQQLQQSQQQRLHSSLHSDVGLNHYPADGTFSAPYITLQANSNLLNNEQVYKTCFNCGMANHDTGTCTQPTNDLSQSSR